MKCVFPEISQEVLEAVKGDILYAAILINRGIDTAEKVKQFKKKTAVNIYDFKDMKKAIERIKKAIKNKEKIIIWGDMDCDGATSVVILYECLQKVGANVDYHVPDRFFDSYGMDKKNIDILAGKNAKLIITVDCGISNVEEIAYAARYGIDVIVTDHHTLPEKLPNAYAIINPKLIGPGHPAYNVSGAVVAYYFARGIYHEFNKKGEENKYLDLVCLSIIGDSVPLLEENRKLLKEGFSCLRETTRPGLLYLMSNSFKNINSKDDLTEEDFAFQIIPRINAAGRMENIKIAIKTLMASPQVAQHYADKLEALNKERKEVQNDIYNKAEEIIENYLKNMQTIQVYKKDWHIGVLGIIAGRIVEVYNKPAIVYAMNEDRETIVASARAPEGMDLMEILNACGKSLIKYGGHKAAAGLSINKKNLKTFMKDFENTVRKLYRTMNEQTIKIDGILQFRQVNEELYNKIRLLAPYGEGFGKPRFLTKRVKIRDVRPFGLSGYELTLDDGTRIIRGTIFQKIDDETKNKEIDIIYTLRKNTWMENNINLVIEKIID